MSTIYSSAVDQWVRNDAQMRINSGLPRKPIRVLDHRVIGPVLRGTSTNRNYVDLAVVYRDSELSDLFQADTEIPKPVSVTLIQGNREIHFSVAGVELNALLHMSYRSMPEALAFAYAPQQSGSTLGADLKRLISMCFDPYVAFTEYAHLARERMKTIPRRSSTLLYSSELVLEAVFYYLSSLYVQSSLLCPQPNIVELSKAFANREPWFDQFCERIFNLIRVRISNKSVLKLEKSYESVRQLAVILESRVDAAIASRKMDKFNLQPKHLRSLADECDGFLKRYSIPRG